MTSFSAEFEKLHAEGRLVVTFNEKERHYTGFFKGVRARLGPRHVVAIHCRSQNRDRFLRGLADKVETAKVLQVLEIV